MELQFGYGSRMLTLELPDSQVISVLRPNKISESSKNYMEVKRSLNNPIGTDRLCKLVGTHRKIAIITSDATRSFPGQVVIPAVLDELSIAGVRDSDITIVFALGSHDRHTEEEMRRLVGDKVFNRFRCIDSSVNNCVNLGRTSWGTPVDIFKPVAEADIRVCIGDIRYHYFAGYSGGAKSVMPGVSSLNAIRSNHKLLLEEGAVAGNLVNNPVREDIEEAVSFCPIDFIVNVVTDEKKDIIHCVSGHFIAAHRAGCALLDKLYRINIPQKADIVVAGAEGFPHDATMYQAQKALENAGRAIRDGGIIIWIALCNKGMGGKIFQDWMENYKGLKDMAAQLRSDFQLGAHKAAYIAMVLNKARVFLISDLNPEYVESLGIRACENARKALDQALSAMGPYSKIIAMPYGMSTLPQL